jgi:MFS family permease
MNDGEAQGASIEPPARPVPRGPIRGVIGSRGLAAFRHRNYRLYWVGQLVSLIGTHMQRAAQAWLVLTLTNDPFMLGLVVAAQFGPVLLFGLFGGIVADSVSKRRTLVVTQAVAMSLAFVLAALAATGTAQVWHVLVLALLLGFTSVVDMPTRLSFVVEMVGRDDVVSAVALNSALVNTAKVIGPAVAGLTISVFSIAFAFFVNGLSFVAVIGGLLAMRSSELEPATRTPLPRTLGAVTANLAEGLGYVRRTRAVLLGVIVVGLGSTAGMNFQVLIAPLARNVLDSGAEGFGFLMAASGLGSVVAAGIVAALGRPRLTIIVLAALSLGIFEIALSVSRSMPISLACMFFVGLSAVTMSMNTNTLIQTLVPDHLRGRVLAVYVTVFAGSVPVGGLIFGAIASAASTTTSILIGGLAVTTVALIALATAWCWGEFARRGEA